MDLKWKDEQQNESENEEHCKFAKIPRKLLIDSPQNQQHQHEPVVAAALPLFLSSDSSSTPPTAIPTSLSRFSGGRQCFSMAQWQELELQAIIYRHMVAGSTIPPELLHLIHKSLLTTPYYLHHYPPASLLQAGYWGRTMDPEPGRCRRTDGKKWRCSRDVVAGHKYCERHVHRGRNRSRKPVEFPPSTAVVGADAVSESLKMPPTAFTVGGSSSFDAFQLHSGGSGELISNQKTLYDTCTKPDSTSRHGKANNTVLMDFFDESTRAGTNGNSFSTSLSMSIPGNQTSDFLRLSTGNIDEVGPRGGNENVERERGQISWTGGWGSNAVASVGGPLAEVLRSSSNSSPTSVLHQLPRCSAPDTSFVRA